ncbi:hypothetical protein [Azospirillum sp. ST 5-10]|uniref:hypothetical protein n=1 Tax=unclassified Azospirillum TaxID=2630922 RepID=UPI003F49E5F2
MTKYIVSKSDGGDLDAVNRGITWLLIQDGDMRLIYGTKVSVWTDILASTAGVLRTKVGALSTTAPADAKVTRGVAAVLDDLCKHHRTALGDAGEMHLCYGAGTGTKSGANPAPEHPVLALYAGEEQFAWVETCVGGDTPFCVVPWRNADVANWVSTHTPTTI